MSALDRQVGGSHYKDYKIQPYEFFFVNEITFEKADIIKRILRYDKPTGKGVEDIDKIMHECEMIKELLRVEIEQLNEELVEIVKQKHISLVTYYDGYNNFGSTCTCEAPAIIYDNIKEPICSKCGRAFELLVE